MVVPFLRGASRPNWGKIEEMKDYLAPFCVAFVAFALVFFALDWVMMDVQGLSLFFEG